MSSFWLNVTARSLVVLLQLVNIKLYAISLPTQELGMYFFWLTVSYSANSFLFVPLDFYIQSNVNRIYSECRGLRALFNLNLKVLSLYISLSFLIVILCVIFTERNTVLAVVIASALALFLYFVQTLRNTLLNLDFSKHVSLSIILEAFLKVIVFYISIHYTEPTALVLIFSWLMALFVTALYLFSVSVYWNIFGGSEVQSISLKVMLNFCYPFSFSAIMGWLQLQGYRLILVPLGYASEVGIFATISNVGSAAIGALSLIYSQQFNPQLYKSNGGYLGTYLKGAFALILIVSFGVLVLGPDIVKLITRVELIPFWKVLLFGVLIDGCNILIGAFAIYISLRADTRQLIPAALIGLFSMTLVFLILVIRNQVSIDTIGFPLLVSQWCIVYYMFYLCFKKSPQVRNSISS